MRTELLKLMAPYITPEIINTVVTMLRGKVRHGTKSERKEAAKLLCDYYNTMNKRIIKHQIQNPRQGQFIAGIFDSPD
jgi:uncharacterized iron-regulated protein